MSSIQLPQGELVKIILTRALGFILVMIAMFFLPAGTFAYWEAWLFIAVLLTPAFGAMIYFLKNEPDLMARRLRMREKQPEQKKLMLFSYLYLFVTYLLPGFDRRFEWSDVPYAVVIMADVLILLGYALVFLVFKENRYASRIIEVEKSQSVISSGPYAVIRHPMYAGAMLMYVTAPLALGSYWAMILSPLLIPIVVARIFNEEAVLCKELKGYQEYTQKVKYRIIPGLW